MADVVLCTRLHSAMGAAVAWEPAGRHVASVATDGTVIVMVRSGPEACVPCAVAKQPVSALAGGTGLPGACAQCLDQDGDGRYILLAGYARPHRWWCSGSTAVAMGCGRPQGGSPFRASQCDM